MSERAPRARKKRSQVGPPEKPVPTQGICLCDGCAADCDLADPEVFAVPIEDCLPLVLCAGCCERVVTEVTRRKERP